MRWDTILKLCWIFSAVKTFTLAEEKKPRGNWGKLGFVTLSVRFPHPTDKFKNRLRVLEKRQSAGNFNGFGNAPAGFPNMGHMMGNSFAGLGAPSMMGGMGGAFPGAMAGMTSSQPMMGMGMGVQGMGANPFAMGAPSAGLGGAQSMMGPSPFGNSLMGGGQQSFSPGMGGMGGGMDMLQQQPQMSMPRFASPSSMMSAPSMGGFQMPGGQGGGQGGMGMGMNLMNSGGGGGGGMGMSGYGMQGGMNMPSMSSGMSTGMGFGGGGGGGGGGYQQSMAPQYPSKRRRWMKSSQQHHFSDGSNTDDGRMPFSSVVDSLKQAKVGDDDDEIDAQEATSCGGCMPLDLRKITGYWTQVFGNPDALRLAFTALANLPSSSEPEEGQEQGPMPSADRNRNDSSVQPSCIGFHFERPFPRRVSDAILGEAPVNMHFRDDRTYKSYQVSGMVQQSLIPNQSEVRLRISTVDIPICLIKGGPVLAGDYDYAIFMETRGSHRCKALHVMTRNSELFFRNYSSDVIEFLQQKVKSGEAETIKVMPNPEQCEPRQQDQWQQQQQQQEREDGKRWLSHF